MKRRNRVWMLALALALVLGAVSGQAEGDLLTTIKERGTIVIATEGDWPPLTYHNENNELVGFDVELGQAIAERLGVKAEFVETNWDAILAGVDSGRFDLACNGVSYTEERAEKYNFSTPYVYAPTVLVVRADNTDINSFADLKGKKTANTISSIYAGIAQEQGAEVVGVDTLADTLQLVQQGRVDATLNSQMSINDYLAEHPDAPIKVVDSMDGDIFVIPVRKGAETDTLITEVDKILDEMRADGTLAALSQKYFNGDLTKNPVK